MPPVITTFGKPIFGQSYGIGWIGFSRADDLIGNAIAYGERWEDDGLPSVNHAFICIGDDNIVEAQLDAGVVRCDLTARTQDPRQRVYFRKPLLWTPDLGQSIAMKALALIGAPYDKLLIAENAIADTLAGHAINELFGNWPHMAADKLIEELTPGEFICSYAAASCLAAQPVYKGLTLFQLPLAAIDPMLLMVEGPFEPFIHAAI